MTSEAPERGLWFGFDGNGEPDGSYCTMQTGDPNEQFWVPYDTALAMVAAENEACAGIARKYDDASGCMDCVDTAHILSEIRARTSDDAKAALDRMLADEREKAVEEVRAWADALFDAAEQAHRDGGAEMHRLIRTRPSLIDGDEG